MEHRFEQPQPQVNWRAPKGVPGQQRQQRLLHTEKIARRHEQVAHRRRVDAIDVPGKSGERVMHLPLEAAPCAFRFRNRSAQAGSHHVGAEERALHREIDAGREYRVDESIGIANHDEVLARHPLGAVRIVSGCCCRSRHLRVDQSFDKGRTLRDQACQETGHIGLAGFHELRRTDGADAGCAVSQRNEPEPAVLKPEDADIASSLARQPPCAGEMSEHRSAGMAAIALLDGKATGEQRVAAGCIHQEFSCEPPLLSIAVMSGRDHATFGREIHLRDAAAFDDASPLGRSIQQQDVIEFGSPDLVRIEQALVP